MLCCGPSAPLLLGYPTHSDYVLADRTARDNAHVDEMLGQVIPAAVANARREQDELAAAKRVAGEDEPFEAADWAYYAAQVRRDRYAFDAAAIRPYLELDRVLVDGVFHAANLLYGVTFERRDDLVGYQPEVTVWEVFDADGSGLGLFVGRLLHPGRQARWRLVAVPGEPVAGCSASGRWWPTT